MSSLALRSLLLGLLAAPNMAPTAADPFRVSVNEQIKLGQQVASQIRRQYHTLPASDDRVKVLRRIGRRILSTFPDSETWQYSFDVIEDKQVNAFALPGGPTFFYTGLISKLRTEDEIAGILGHELTHVRQQHWARMYAAAQKRQLFMTAALIFLRVNYTGAQLADLANNLMVLGYSRGDEAAADQGGFENSVNAGFNPQGLADAFEMLDKLGGHAPEFLSDHPSDTKRVRHIEDDIKKSGKSFPAQKPLPWADFKGP
ncbi:MAG TPA: M48 family metalloprotease [Fimbriimonadaceae bacterium]|nr:M48 family metalloprotease [Fimbriimonadaceae bacterium]